ncbi:bifunctional diguanylate cyclase/phosphodiesterase [Kineosporia sp. R_H_3]|uniref:putative bifunctional diguanylate cyclase/phosphodiesterase n=1 Tax=Kineosporia sp. R_H_3 TaxID=1961848 RepID=UPI00130463A4|nr:bifunctional diguanylate cyclase/phosphodiesterase [Kineosporia sp. R_H_3]
MLNSTAQPETVSFPAPGEWLFLAAYIGFSAFLVLDRAGATQAAGGGWLDGLIIVGGTACVALVAVLTPFAADPGGALPLLVALIYPLLDVTLLLLVVAQMALRQRPVGGRGLVLAAAFVVLGIADTSLVASARSGSYQSGELFDVTWCVGFLLLVEAACHRAGRTVPDDVTQPKPGAIPIILAATVALVTLLPQQATGIRLVVVAPALVTLLAAGLRLGLALRQAQQLNEALLLSRTDDLTGLPNRRALNDLLGSDRDSGGHGLLLLDLDGFKEINDTLGHAAGDAVLRAIGSRIRAAVDASALVVRLGGDEFAVAVPQDDPVRLTELAFRLRDAVRKPVRVDGLEVCLDVSIGIAVRDDGTAGVGGLLRRADVAMYQAKTGRAGVLVYDAARDDFSRERLRIAEELRRGIDSGEIVVWYQPKVDATTGAPTGVEALVRWSHPKDGLLPPAAFLPAARRTGLMPALTRAVLAQVISDLARWRSDGLDMHAAVNVAPAELLAPAVMSDLFGMIARAGLGDGSLVIEVTEDSFLADPDRAREVIEAIGARGIEVAIDDFGTGYSSLAYLRDLPVQELKIDRSFVSDILTNPRNEMIVRTTLELGRGLGMRTVAEGVEDEVIAERLRELGVDELQGYHFARPMPPAHLATWLVERTARTVTRS